MQEPNLQEDRNLEGIVEVKELFDLKKVNDLLGKGNWRLLDVTTEKVKREIPVKNYQEFLFGLVYEGTKTVSIVEEELTTKYILGRYNRD